MERSTTIRTARRRPRRDLVALAASVLVAAIAPLVGPHWLWPLAAVPMSLATAVAGPRGLGVCVLASVGTATGLVASGAPPAPIAVGIGALAGAAGLSGARHAKVARDLERLAGASLVDRLTGLHNFAYFTDVLGREHARVVRYGGDLSLVLMDLDGFKSFNDAHGHDVGNDLLAAVGGVIGATCRSTDVAARFGGEEFAVLVNGPAPMAIELAERIRRAVQRIDVPVGAGRRDGRTISAGIAELGPDEKASDLLRRADRALYRSKHRGRNRVSVSADGGPSAAAG